MNRPNFDPRLEYTAVRLRNCWAIKPKGCLGTCGWTNGIPWIVWYTKRKPDHIQEEK